LIWGNPRGLGNWNGEGMGRGRSVYEQPGTRVDRIAPHKRRDSKYVKGDSRGRRNQQGELTKGKQQGIIGKGLHFHLTLLTCINISYHCINAANKRMCLGYK
jgi:hypothetical protein